MVTVNTQPLSLSGRGVPGSTRPSTDEKMLLRRTGVITLWTDIFTLRPALNSGPTTQRTYGSRPRHDGGQDAPVSWLSSLAATVALIGRAGMSGRPEDWMGGN